MIDKVNLTVQVQAAFAEDWRRFCVAARSMSAPLMRQALREWMLAMLLKHPDLSARYERLSKQEQRNPPDKGPPTLRIVK